MLQRASSSIERAPSPRTRRMTLIRKRTQSSSCGEASRVDERRRNDAKTAVYTTLARRRRSSPTLVAVGRRLSLVGVTHCRRPSIGARVRRVVEAAISSASKHGALPLARRSTAAMATRHDTPTTTADGGRATESGDHLRRPQITPFKAAAAASLTGRSRAPSVTRSVDEHKHASSSSSDAQNRRLSSL